MTTSRQEHRMPTHRLVRAVTVALTLGLASAAHAQTSDTKWSIDVGIGWDNSISGNINSSTIGSINNQTVVILTNQYEEVYGTGLHFRVGGGYMLNPTTEARVALSVQALDSDLATLGDYGASPLYGDYTDYESTTLDFGLRRYARSNTNLRPYAEGSIGLGFINEIDLALAAPQANLTTDANNFYQQTASFTWAVQAGLLWSMSNRLGGFAQLGLRYVSGLADVDNFVGEGLESINDNSSRWTLPFLIGVRVGF
jgi:Outer membrane protein beta-barrel domain